MFDFTARVIKGQGNGKKLGFPTINLEVNPPNPIYQGGIINLNYGVYACKVKILNSTELQTYLGAMHYGKRETMNLPESIEIHLLDFENSDLYDAEVEVEVLEKIRDVVKFNSIDELIKQIGKDISFCHSCEGRNP